MKVLYGCTGNLTTEDDLLECNTDYSQVTTTPSKSIQLTPSKSILAGILASIFGGIALGVIIVFVIAVVTYRNLKPRPGGQDGPHPLKKRTPTYVQ